MEQAKKQKVTISESKLMSIIKEALNEYGVNTPQQVWEKYDAMLRRGVEPVFETEGGIMYFKYDSSKNEFLVGGATNAGFVPEMEFPYDLDASFDENLQNLSDAVYEKYGQYDAFDEETEAQLDEAVDKICKKILKKLNKKQ